MEEQTLNDILGCKEEQPTNQYRKTGKKYVYTKKYLSAFSVFIRVLLIILWGSMVLDSVIIRNLGYMIIIGALIGGLLISIFWFTLGNIYSTKEIECEEYEKCENINN